MAQNPTWMNQPQNTWPPSTTPGFFLTAPPNRKETPPTGPPPETPPITGGGGGIFAPTVVDIIDDCMRSVTVSVIHDSAKPSPDVIVDVFVNGVWKGSSIFTFPIIQGLADQIARVEVPLSICSLKIGDLVQSQVTDNGITSALSTGVRVVSHVPYSVLTEHYDNNRTGWYPYAGLTWGSPADPLAQAPVLTTQSLSQGNLSLQMMLPVDSKTYAQPLYMHHQFFPNLGPINPATGVPTGEAHNAVFLATENDSIIAYDADDQGPNGNGKLLWARTGVANPILFPNSKVLLPPGFMPVNSPNLIPFGDIPFPIGISSTPVIDCGCNSGSGASGSGNSNGCCCCSDGKGDNSSGATNCGCCRTATMYVVSKSQRGSDIPNDPDHPTFHFFLHAIDVTTGEDRPNSPVEITGQVSGTSGTVFDPILHPNGDINGFGSNDGKGHVIFVPRYHNNRVSLLLVNGTIYIGFASQEDAFEHHGWIFAYDSITLEQKNIFCTTPDFAPPDFRPEGGIWQSGFGLSTDGKAIYCTVGNGSFNANIGGADYGDSVLKLSLDLTLLSFFTPAAQDAMRRSDNDLGSGGVLIIPQQQGSSSNLLVTAGKDGEVFLLDRNNLGGYSGPQGITQGLVYLTNNNALFPTVTRPGVTAMQAQGDNSPGVWGGPAYYNGPFGPFIFYCSNGQDGNSKNLVRFNLANNALIRPMSGAMVDPKSQDATNVFFLGGGTPIVSSDQSSTGTGILWVIKRGDNNNNQIPSNIRLLAYDATDLSTPLQNIQYGRWGTPAAAPNKTGGRAFIEPTVINGRVYVSHLDNNSNNFFISVFSL